MSSPATPRDWHSAPLDDILSQVESSPQGLSDQEASERLQKNGPNQMPDSGPTPLWMIILRQFYSPLIYILVAAAVVSALTGEFKDAGFIGLVLIINAAIGAYQEWRAEQSSEALKKLLSFHARVLRSGQDKEIAAEEIVVGDIINLESGNRVPGDVRLLEAKGLEVDESMLTGESAAVLKDAGWQGAANVPAADRLNMAMAGSMVMRGRGAGVVVATGADTSIGQLARDVASQTGGRPPLIERMETFTNYIAIGTVAVSLLIGILVVTITHNSWFNAFLFMVALAVSAIPEGLPVAMTVALSVAAIKMSRRNVIVRTLTAVEGLGSCTLIATDKTGTLTCNQMTVRELRLANGAQVSFSGEGYSPDGQVKVDDAGTSDSDTSRELLAQATRAGMLCNEATLEEEDGKWTGHGDAVDVSFLIMGLKQELRREQLLEEFPQVDQIPYEPEHQFAASFHREGDATVAYVKGSPERVLTMCADSEPAGQDEGWEQVAQEMAGQGMRMLALARGTVTNIDELKADPGQLHGLELIGLVGLIDPLRPTARDAIQRCREAGVKVVMITGDHRATALAISRDLGLVDQDDQVATGQDLDQTPDEQLPALLDRVRVFARVAPGQKLRIVEGARRQGHFVAVTGDGVNDAPALRAANIGVAMGQMGTDVARDAADLVLSDDNFESIVAGIEEGRIAYDNIRKVVFLLTSMGAAELVMVLLAVLTGVPIPLLPVQLLWLNLVTDGIQGVALAFEPGEGDTLRRKPRPPHEPIFNRLMIERMVIGVGVVAIGGFAAFYGALQWGLSVEGARNFVLLVMVLFENFHVGNARSETKSVFVQSPFHSPFLLAGTIGALLIHLGGMYLPFMQSVLKTEAVGWQEWGIALLIALIVLPAMELQKWSWRTRFPEDAQPVPQA